MHVSGRGIPTAALLGAACAGAFGCSVDGSANGGSVSRETIDGVEVVTVRGTGRLAEPVFELEPALELRQDPTDEASLLYEIRDFALGGDGNFYVADTGNSRIAVFDPDGRYTRAFGRAGEGPGEFGPWIRFVGSLGDEIQVFDSRARRTQRFSFDGAFLGAARLPEAGRLESLAIDPDGGRVARRGLSDRRDDLIQAGGVLEVYPPGADEPTVVVKTGLTPSLVFTQIDNGDGTVAVTSVQIPFTGTNEVLRHEDGVVAVDGEVGEVRWYDGTGALRRRMVLDEPRAPVTAEMRAAFEDSWRLRQERFAREGRTFVAPLPEIWYPEVAGVWRDARLDDRGRLWLRDAVHASSRQDGDPERYWVVAPDGELLGAVAVPSGEIRVQAGLVLAHEEDRESGEARLRVYGLRPHPELGDG